MTWPWAHTTDAWGKGEFRMHLPSSVARAETRLRRHLEALQAWVQKTILWQLWERLVENEFIERSVALAAKAFVSLFPALIVVAAFLPTSARNSVLATLLRRLGLQGSNSVKQAFAGSSDIRRATGVVGLVFTFFYINSFITALQRIYVRVWRRPKSGAVYGYAIGAAWLVGIVAYLGLIGGARALLGHGPKSIGFAVIALAFTIATWTVTPWIMLKRQIRFRALIATGIVTGTGLAVYGATAALWMPTTVGKNEQQFGAFGIALALVTWLTGATTIVVIGACVSPVLAEDTGVLGRLVRGPDGVSVPNGTASDASTPHLE
jgi:membrane protein